MTLDEVKAHVADGYNPILGYSDAQSLYMDFPIYSDTHWREGVMLYATIRNKASQYGVSWRCWTAKPTDDQRAAAKWEG